MNKGQVPLGSAHKELSGRWGGPSHTAGAHDEADIGVGVGASAEPGVGGGQGGLLGMATQRRNCRGCAWGTVTARAGRRQAEQGALPRGLWALGEAAFGACDGDKARLKRKFQGGNSDGKSQWGPSWGLWSLTHLADVQPGTVPTASYYSNGR